MQSLFPRLRLLGCIARKSSCQRSFSTEPATLLKRTALYEDHVKLGGKMVPFSGYELPVQYGDSILQSHLHCRKSASVFDVSHMGQLRILGDKRTEFVESITVADIAALSTNQARLSLITNDRGGIIDDCMITKKQDHIYMVINAGCKDKDIAHMKLKLIEFNKKYNANVSIEIFSDQWELIAFQGPLAAQVMSRLVPPSVDISKLPFMYSANLSVGDVQCIVSRCGYTGEDGFEISIPKEQTSKLFHSLLEHKEVLPAGLGARDSLRLEAGLCLYGHDLSEDITPVEANLTWTITKRRRAEGGYPGSDVVAKQLKDGVTKKRVGLNILAGAPAREGAIILDKSDQQVGAVTSGTWSPVLSRSIAMAYVNTDVAALNTSLRVNVRGKINEANVTKMPFVPNKYYKLT